MLLAIERPARHACSSLVIRLVRRDHDEWATPGDAATARGFATRPART